MMIFPPFKPLLAHSLSAQQPIRLMWLALGSLPVVEFAAQVQSASQQPQALVLDLQHGLWDASTVHTAVGLAAPVPVIARCAGHQPHQLAQALDAGAASVLVPMVQSEDEAQQAVLGSHYPPAGLRSAGGVRPLLAGAAQMLKAGGQVAVGVMIETVRGVENVERIVRVPGVDYVFIGTGDLSLSRGIEDAVKNAAQVEKDCQRVQAAAHAAGLPCGRYTASAACATAAFGQGFQMAVTASDIDVIRDGFLQAAKNDGHTPSSERTG